MIINGLINKINKNEAE